MRSRRVKKPNSSKRFSTRLVGIWVMITPSTKIGLILSNIEMNNKRRKDQNDFHKSGLGSQRPHHRLGFYERTTHIWTQKWFHIDREGSQMGIGIKKGSNDHAHKG